MTLTEAKNLAAYYVATAIDQVDCFDNINEALDVYGCDLADTVDEHDAPRRVKIAALDHYADLTMQHRTDNRFC